MSIETLELKVAEWAAGGKIILVLVPLRLAYIEVRQFPALLADDAFPCPAIPRHVIRARRRRGKPEVGIHLPIPVR